MREPVFTETMQIGIVVRDLAATMQRYVDDYGIGPWDIVEFHPEDAPDLHEHGKPVGRSWRLASTMIGRVQWELIEPLDDESVYARFLAEKGEGVHHIAVASSCFDEAVAGPAGTLGGLLASDPRLCAFKRNFLLHCAGSARRTSAAIVNVNVGQRNRSSGFGRGNDFVPWVAVHFAAIVTS